MALGEQNTIHILIALSIVGLFGIITFALAAATLGTLNKRFNDLNERLEILHQDISNITGLLFITTTTRPSTTTQNTTTIIVSITTPTSLKT
ncbi:unnamed protein product [Rotaria sp. Silwood1]|nr:unnamed protein product [Rotaria sp. Silwood1]